MIADSKGPAHEQADRLRFVLEPSVEARHPQTGQRGIRKVNAGVAKVGVEDGQGRTKCLPGVAAASEQPDEDTTGSRLWPAALALTSYLLSESPARDWTNVRALELGAGLGLVGLALASRGADVVLTELAGQTNLLRQENDVSKRQLQFNIASSLWSMCKCLPWRAHTEIQQD